MNKTKNQISVQDLYALSKINGLGKKSLLKIINRLESINDLISDKHSSEISDLIVSPQKNKIIQAIKDHFFEYQEMAQNEIEQIKERGLDIISYLDEFYPIGYKQINDPPIFLYCKGNKDLLKYQKNVAIVGTRECTEYGKKIAQSTARYFAEKGFNIVSGLAMGIDTAAHQGALSVNGYTTAVLVDVENIYPDKNTGLAKNILENKGLLLSENPPNTYVGKHQFVLRDRLQSALSLAVFPIETDVKGGTMHTVKYAAEQNKKIYCPNLQLMSDYPLNNKVSRGILKLINDRIATPYTKDTYDTIIKSITKETHREESKTPSAQMSMGF